MYCKKCGNKIDDDSVFCNFCGTKQNTNDKIFDEKQRENNSIDVNIRIKPPKINLAKIKRDRNNNSTRYDYSYNTPNRISYYGFFYAFIFFLLNLSIEPFLLNEYSAIRQIIVDNNLGEMFLFIALFSYLYFRIRIIIWVSKVAKLINRYPLYWVMFATLLPILTMVIIGFKKKLKYEFSTIPIRAYDDSNYRSNPFALVVGYVMIIVYFLILHFYLNSTFPKGITINIFLITAFAFRIIGIQWVKMIARKLNREPYDWAKYALIAPSLSLIFISQKRKFI